MQTWTQQIISYLCWPKKWRRKLVASLLNNGSPYLRRYACIISEGQWNICSTYQSIPWWFHFLVCVRSKLICKPQHKLFLCKKLLEIFLPIFIPLRLGLEKRSLKTKIWVNCSFGNLQLFKKICLKYFTVIFPGLFASNYSNSHLQNGTLQ
jgi:hypothetical protein